MSSDEPEKDRLTGEAADATGEAEVESPDGAAGADDAGDDDAGDEIPADDSTDSVDTPAEETDAEEASVEETGTEETPAEETSAESDSGRAGLPRWTLIGASAFATAAFVVAAVFGVLWLLNATGDDADVAHERQDVVRVTGQAVTAFTELDYTKLDEYFQRQKDLATGDLANQIKQAEGTYRKAISQAKSKVTTTVHDIAVNELNEREGKASAIAAASTKVQRGDQQGNKTMRLEIQLSRQGEDAPWKVSQIGDVPVAGAGQQ